MRMRTLILVVAGLIAVAAVPARADVVPLLINVTPSFNPGKFLWNFNATVNVGQRLSPLGIVPPAGVTPADDTRSIKDYTTIYDFGGFTGTVVIGDPTRFAFVTYNMGSTPQLVTPPDLPNFLNVTIYRIPEAPPDCCGFKGSFTFSIESFLSRTRSANGWFASDGTKDNPGQPSDGTGVSNIGRVESPFQQSVPEPGTLLLVGAGLFGLGIYRRKKL